VSNIALSLAQSDGPHFDLQAWGVIIVAIMVALSSLYQKLKHKGEPADKAGQGQPPQEAPRTAARPTAPTPQPRPALQVRVPSGRPMPTRAEFPPVRNEPPPQPAVRVPVGQRSAAEPAALEALRAARRSSSSPPSARPAAAYGPSATAGPVHAPPILATPAQALPHASPVQPDVRRAVHDRRGLQAAFVLSEILAPPLALRDEHRA
jgi:hypothetical protein